jgi:hypothetical protein
MCHAADAFIRVTGEIAAASGTEGPGFTWESAPIKREGKIVKLKGKTLMLSPANYRLQMQISVDGGPFTNFGSPWFRRTEG